MSEPQKITTEIILADFIPAPARTPELAREITIALRAENQAALEQIIQRTHQAFAAQQRQIDTQQIELNRIRQEVKRLKRQPQITYNISDNRSINYIQSTSNSWNTYSQSNYTNHTRNTYEISWNAHNQNSQNRSNHIDSTHETSWNAHNQNSQNRSNHIDSTYETSWNTYGQSAHNQPDRRQQNQSQGHNYNRYDRQFDTYTEEDSAGNCLPSLGSWWPLPLIVLLAWGAWACENQQKTQQTPPAIQRAR